MENEHRLGEPQPFCHQPQIGALRRFYLAATHGPSFLKKCGRRARGAKSAEAFQSAALLKIASANLSASASSGVNPTFVS